MMKNISNITKLMTRSALGTLAIAATLLLLAHVALGSEPETTVKIQDGVIAGAAVDGVDVFKGIPFAAPPVGPNRWRAPQPVVPWKGVLDADTYGPTPMQNKAMAMFIAGNASVKISEDCLYLNVWTTSTKSREKRPVMVWIYGGAYNIGYAGCPLTDGAKLAKRGVVLVSIGYRVGPFGFLAHPDLSQESGHGSGNYGLMDQIAGLRWVKRNIARFGGDPSNVTIFGESAGGESTALLAASPQAHGLFNKVICESGPAFAPVQESAPGPAAVCSLAAAEKHGQNFLQKLGVGSIAAARSLSADTIQDAAAGYTAGAVVDGYVIPDDPYRLYMEGRFNDTPVLVGCNSDDGGMFTPPELTTSVQFEALARSAYSSEADALLAAYPYATDEQASLSARHYVRDSVFGWGAWTWARLETQKGKNAAYVYYFDRHAADSPNGAGHGAEVPYVFGFVYPMFGLRTAEDIVFSDKIQQYWVNFAKTGDPNGPGLEPWPAFHAQDAKALTFDDIAHAQPLPNLEQINILDRHYAKQRAAEPAVSESKR
jgi:para-nitrobenzyl esterase